MEEIGIIFLLIIGFVVLGLMGWGIKAFGWVFEFLKEGFSSSIGCLFWLFMALLLLMGLAAA